MIIDRKTEFILKINYDFNDDEIESLRSMENRLRCYGVSEQHIEAMLLLRIDYLNIYSDIRFSYRGKMVCNEELFLLQEASIDPDNGITETIFIDTYKENYLRIVFGFNDADIQNMRDLEVKLKEMSLLSDYDIITILNMRVGNIDLLKRKRVEGFRNIPDSAKLKTPPQVLRRSGSKHYSSQEQDRAYERER